jgi:hypothetical protein
MIIANKLILLALPILLIIGCGDKKQNENIINSKDEIPSHWKKTESKDAMTDQVTKYYDVASNESTSYGLSVGCSKKGFLNFYVEYPSRSGMPSSEMEVTVRIDNDPPFNEKWYVSWVNGATTVENPYTFFSKIKGKSKLAVEIFGAAKNTFNISGIENVVSDMESTACQFEDKKIIKELSATDMPKFAALCEANNIPPFILVTEPSKQRLFFSRQDHLYDPHISTEIKLTEKTLKSITVAPCCKDSPETLEFNRQTGELKRLFSSGGGAVMQCERINDSQYETELSNSIEHYTKKLIEAQNKTSASQAQAQQQRDEQIQKNNQPNKF